MDRASRTSTGVSRNKSLTVPLLLSCSFRQMYDCYRPTGAVANFVAWASDLSDTLMQAEFYPTESKANLFADGYIAYHSGHSRGSTMDLTIVAMPAAGQPTYQPGVTVLQPCFAPVGVRWADNSIDMGTGFDCFSTISWTNDTSIDVQAQFNRLMLLQAMTFEGGFINYDEEWSVEQTAGRPAMRDRS